MKLKEAIAEANRLMIAWPVGWCVIQRNGEFALKLRHSKLNGHRIGIDFSETEIVW